MQNMFNKSFGVALGILLLISSNGNVSAQADQEKYRSYIKQIKGLSGSPNMSYRYKVSLMDTKSNKEVDQMEGVLLKRGKSYMDSNSTVLTLCNDGFFFKAKSRDKEAYVYSMAVVEKQLGIKKEDFANNIVALPDSTLLKNGRFAAYEAKGNLEIRYVVSQKGSPVQEIHFKVRKQDMQLLELKVISKEREYLKVFTITDFKTDFDGQRMDLRRYFKVSGGKVKLQGRFQSYQLQSLL
jgi:hypothetical protein